MRICVFIIPHFVIFVVLDFKIDGQRMTISEIMEDDWFKKDYNPPCFDVEEDVKFDDIDVAFNNSEVRF